MNAITVRVSREHLALLKEAADLEGRNLSDFTLSTLTAKTNDVLAEQGVFRLTGARWNQLMVLWDQRPVARPVLADALRMYAKRVERSVSDLRIVPLEVLHDVSEFSSGEDSLDQWLRDMPSRTRPFTPPVRSCCSSPTRRVLGGNYALTVADDST